MRPTRIIILLLTLCVVAGAAVQPVLAMQDISAHPKCDHCGMGRKAYGYSRMLVSYADGAKVGVCSLHCAVTELSLQKGRQVKLLQVADRTSHELVDATTAFWVMGGRKRGVMTAKPKWAFASRESADAFMADFGGIAASWDECLAAAQKEAQ